jgi:hypothetical protein
MEDRLKDFRKIADKVVFNDHSHEKDIIRKVNQRINGTTKNNRQKWIFAGQYFINGSILAIFALTFTIILVNNLGGSGQEKPSLNEAKTVESVLQYDPKTFEGIIYAGLSEDYGLETTRGEGLTQNYHNMITSNYVQLEIEDVYFDDANLAIAYRIFNQGNQMLNKRMGSEFSISLNNKVPNGHYSLSMMREKQISPKEYQGIIKIYFENPNPDFTLNLSTESIMGIKGDWSFDIPISLEKIKNRIGVFYPDYKTGWQDGGITVNKVIITPTAVKVHLDSLTNRRSLDASKGPLEYSLVLPDQETGRFGYGLESLLNDGETFGQSTLYFPLVYNGIPKEISMRAYYQNGGPSPVHEFTFPLQRKKDFETNLKAESDSKTTVIPAKIIKNFGIVKEIKVPVDGQVRNFKSKGDTPSVVNKEGEPFIFENATSKMIIAKNNMENTIQNYLEQYKHFHHEKNIDVEKVDLKKYPQLKGYDRMMKAEGDNSTEYYLIKSFKKDGRKKVIEVRIQFPANSDDTFLSTMINSLGSAKFY